MLQFGAGNVHFPIGANSREGHETVQQALFTILTMRPQSICYNTVPGKAMRLYSRHYLPSLQWGLRVFVTIQFQGRPWDCTAGIIYHPYNEASEYLLQYSSREGHETVQQALFTILTMRPQSICCNTVPGKAMILYSRHYLPSLQGGPRVFVTIQFQGRPWDCTAGLIYHPYKEAAEYLLQYSSREGHETVQQALFTILTRRPQSICYNTVPGKAMRLYSRHYLPSLQWGPRVFVTIQFQGRPWDCTAGLIYHPYKEAPEYLLQYSSREGHETVQQALFTILTKRPQSICYNTVPGKAMRLYSRHYLPSLQWGPRVFVTIQFQGRPWDCTAGIIYHPYNEAPEYLLQYRSHTVVINFHFIHLYGTGKEAALHISMLM